MMDDKTIVDLYLRKDQNALSASAEKYGTRLKQISFRIVHDISDAEECENDTYLSAWNSIPPHAPNHYLFAFLAKIVRNISLNLYTKNHTQKRYAHIVELSKEMEECLPAPSDDPCSACDSELMQCINRFLLRLSEEERTVFVRRYWFADSIKEVASRFNISESKTKSMLLRTRNKLKKYFESEGLQL